MSNYSPEELEKMADEYEKEQKEKMKIYYNINNNETLEDYLAKKQEIADQKTKQLIFNFLKENLILETEHDYYNYNTLAIYLKNPDTQIPEKIGEVQI